MELKFGTKEWADNSFNFMFGCKHDCLYCYAKSINVRYKRCRPGEWSSPKLREHKKFPLFKGTVMSPTTHDIFPDSIDFAIKNFRGLLERGNSLLIVSKPHIECVDALTKELSDFRDRIIMRFSIGSMNDEALKFWEPGAATFSERKACLSMAFDRGYETSVSAEPFLDDRVLDLFRDLAPLVREKFWIGKMNMVMSRLKANGRLNSESEKMARILSFWQSDERIKDIFLSLREDPKIAWKESIIKVVSKF